MRSKNPSHLLLLIGSVLLATAIYSSPAKADFGTADTNNSYYEVGAVIGYPALINALVGYWNGPAIFRFSGGYYGKTTFYGIQGEVGWAFYREPELKQYVGVIGTQIAGSRHNALTHTTMLGIMYGVNWHGLSVEAGPETMIGPYETAHGFKGGITGQIGYTFLFSSL